MRNSGVGNAKFFSSFSLISHQSEEKTNDILGSFLFNADKDHIFKLKESLENLQHFIESLGELSGTIMVECVTSLYHSDQIDNLTSQKVLKAANERVQKMIKNRKLKKNWSTPDILILVWVLAKYIEINLIQTTEDLNTEDWNKIAQLIPGTSGDNCLFRWLNLHKNRLSSNQWSTEQSNLLKKIVKEKGIQNWKQFAEELYKLYDDRNKVFRTAKQCRQHWACYLNPVLKKGPWQQEEDIKLIKEILAHKGAKKWSVIAKKFNGRTQNALKNRYNLLIQKEIKIEKKNKSENINQIERLRNYLQQRCINPHIQNSSEEKIILQNQMRQQQISSKTETNIERNKKFFQTLFPSGMITSAFTKYNKNNQEKVHVQKKDIKQCINFCQQSYDQINYFICQYHHK